MTTLFDTSHGDTINSSRCSSALEEIARNTREKEHILTQQELEYRKHELEVKTKLTKHILNEVMMFMAIFMALTFIMLLLILL